MKSTERVFDGLLVLQCRSGDKKAYSLLVKRWHQKLCKQAYWYTKDINLAKDVAQDSWAVIFKKLNTLSDPNSFGSWALSIVNRKSIDYLRKVSRRNEHLKTYYKELDLGEKDEAHKNSTIDNGHTHSSDSQIIVKAIKELPENQQAVLQLFYVEEYSVLEISKILNISRGTVKSRLFYAREKLKSILKNKNHEKS
ncbi:MAG: RNA polymerase sigma factor [Flavobacteriaceae bacterium]|nr:RNA polymerase sigma factor [Flavobacteriaceae bacterium]